jgi:hypothetical protein
MPSVQQLQAQRQVLIEQKATLQSRIVGQKLTMKESERRRIVLELQMIDTTMARLNIEIAKEAREESAFKVITDGIQRCKNAKAALNALMEYTTQLEQEVASLKRQLEQTKDTHEF